MKNKISPNRYSDAIFRIASEDRNVDEWKDFLKNLEVALSDIEVRSFLEGPKISLSEKIELFKKAEIEEDHKQFSFLKMLLERNHIFMTGEILQKFNTLLDKSRGIRKAEIISAFPLSDLEISNINQMLNGIVDAEVQSQNIVDRSILGGFIAKFDDQMLDMSFRGKLNQMKQKILE
ncbi:MAG: ATP synthase F1 subunit delta [Actinobacteria bacterium]|nr:ATP synthase F1 subunit delta [Actinomycetota bacterium]